MVSPALLPLDSVRVPASVLLLNFRAQSDPFSQASQIGGRMIAETTRNIPPKTILGPPCVVVTIPRNPCDSPRLAHPRPERTGEGLSGSSATGRLSAGRGG